MLTYNPGDKVRIKEPHHLAGDEGIIEAVWSHKLKIGLINSVYTIASKRQVEILSQRSTCVECGEVYYKGPGWSLEVCGERCFRKSEGE